MPGLLFVDDAGGQYPDRNQPVVTFCGPYVPSTKLHAVETDLCSLREATEQSLFMEISGRLSKGTLTKAMTDDFKAAVKFLNKVEKGQFELHGKQLIKGLDEYMFLDLANREKIVASVLTLIATHGLSVMAGVVEKAVIRSDATILEVDKDPSLQKRTITNLLTTAETYLEDQKDTAFIVVDEGNSGIRQHLVPTLRTSAPKNLAHEALEYASYRRPLIQLADHCAYVIYQHYKNVVEGTSDPRTDKLFAIVKNQLQVKADLLAVVTSAGAKK